MAGSHEAEPVFLPQDLIEQASDSLYGGSPQSAPQHQMVAIASVNDKPGLAPEHYQAAIEYANDNISDDPYILMDTKLGVADRAASSASKIIRTAQTKESKGEGGDRSIEAALQKTELAALVAAEAAIYEGTDRSCPFINYGYNLARRLENIYRYQGEAAESYARLTESILEQARLSGLDERIFDAYDIRGKEGLRRAYLDQAKFRASTANEEDRPEKADELVLKALEYTDADNISVSDEPYGLPGYLELTRYPSVSDEAKDAVYQKVLEVTRQSNREPQIKKKESMFGIKRRIKQPSVFEERRQEIGDFINRLSLSGEDTIINNPEFFIGWVELHRDKGEQTRLYRDFGREALRRNEARLLSPESLRARRKALEKIVPEDVARDLTSFAQEREPSTD